MFPHLVSGGIVEMCTNQDIYHVAIFLDIAESKQSVMVALLGLHVPSVIVCTASTLLVCLSCWGAW